MEKSEELNFHERERGHEFALHRQDTLDKASIPANFTVWRTNQGLIPGPALLPRH
jgi:hypothetical protein